MFNHLLNNYNPMDIKKPTSFIKAGENIQNGDIVQLLDEGTWDKLTNPDGKERDVLKFEMKLPNEEIKTYTMNNTTIDNLTTAYGTDSQNWMNKDLKAHINRDRAFGKVISILILTPPEWQDTVPPENVPIVEEKGKAKK